MKRTLVTLLLLIATVALYAADQPSFPGGDQALNKYLAENGITEDKKIKQYKRIEIFGEESPCNL